jgi:hypothetical protein
LLICVAGKGPLGLFFHDTKMTGRSWENPGGGAASVNRQEQTLRMAGADFSVVRATGSDNAGSLPVKCNVPPQTLDAIAAGNPNSGYDRSPGRMGSGTTEDATRIGCIQETLPHTVAVRTGRAFVANLVRSRRLELPRGYPHKHLKLARLPFRHDRNVV